MSRKTPTKRGRNTSKGCTPLEERFCHEFLEDGKAGPALKRAGSTARNLNQQAHEMKQRPHVAERIAQLMAIQNEKTAVDAIWVQNELVMLYRNARNAADPPRTVRQKGPVKTNEAARSTALRALEKIGSLVTVNAFRHQVGLSNPDGSNLDLTGLSDADLDQLETLLSKAALSGGDSSGEEPTIQ